ncbi:MAG: GNAT family N-acetyltransferase [Flavobacteriaceae bacterium]|jgi:8-oxo-dGTP pyrophosphatase MutT (NUDIX family)|nr:GNAT family N-acetyltransferase [Flavobacteriaceae bacterium]
MSITTSFLRFELAQTADCVLLSETALQSKAHWGYSSEELNQWITDLTITAQHLEQYEVYKCFAEDVFVGFFAVEYKQLVCVLEHLWLLPQYIGKGYGYAVVKEVKALALKHSCTYITVVADPNANGFYERMGGKIGQTIPSSIAGRYLTMYYLTVVEEEWVNLPTAGLIIMQDQDQVLLAYSNNKKAWYLPGGKIDQGEESQSTLIREIEEELSLQLDKSRLRFLTHIVAPAYGEKKNILMQQDCYLYDLKEDVIAIANEIGGVKYFDYQTYVATEIPVPGVLMVFDYLNKQKG